MSAVRAPAILVALNAEKVANADPRVREVANRNLGYADGMGVVLALRRKGLRAARIAGADLWLALAGSRAGARVYLIGSTTPVVRRAAQLLQALHPHIQIAGFRDGFLAQDEVSELKAQLALARPDLVFVGMGSPTQELLMDELIESLPAVYMGIGGSLEVFVGRRRRAPRWMQRVGAEWLFRFVENPSRLSRLPAYLRFAWLLGRGKV